MNTPPFIAVTGLHKNYVDGEGRLLQILRGLDLQVSQGDTVAIMGPSGAGKSTLLHLIGALDRPDGGRIAVGGQEISGLAGEAAARFRNETVGFVFQFHHLLMDFTALENVLMPIWIRSGRTDAGRGKAEALLDQVGLAGRVSHRPAQLSGGEQQRVAIARAIINEPKILLADEPTGNLDTKNSEIVLEMLRRLNKDLGQTVVMITHNPEATTYFDRVVHMRDGVLVDGIPAD